MKLLWRTSPYYTLERGIKKKPFGLRSKFLLSFELLVFLIITSILTFVYSSFGGRYKSKAELIVVPTISSSITRGVTMPPTVNAIKNNAVINKKENKKRLVVSTGYISKPIWLSKSLYVDPYNSAADYVIQNPDALLIKRMSKIPVAQWFGDWNKNISRDVNTYVSAANSTGSVPILVAYNIPYRDCGGFSVGGSEDISNYTAWIQQFANGIGNRTAVVVLEPDALGALDCLPSSKQGERTKSIADAVNILKKQPNTFVYIDGGTPVWQPTKVIASRLLQANVEKSDGFSLNVSYFSPTWQNQSYGDQVSKLVGNKHYIIDTSRNGGNHMLSGMQCNPSFASLGQLPTTNTGKKLNDALLWIKIPWESDGPCNGGPGPGQSYWNYATQLALNAGW